MTDDAIERLAASKVPSLRHLQDRIDAMVGGVIRLLEQGQPVVTVDHELLSIGFGL